ncbi:uncharacterized protein [Macrobrachium rosenbergii]|uniref:uncharacterized protein n=1 Tax=Macrobrachium rosenbergii TaxID=79674 RepID=UPI0034D5BD9B
MNCAKTAKEAWEALKTKSETKGHWRYVYLVQAMSQARFQDFSDMEGYTAHITSLGQEMKSLGEEVKGKYLIAMIFQGLPSEYDSLVMTLCAGEKDMVLDTVITKLLDDSQHRDVTGAESGDRAAFFTNKKSPGKKGNDNKQQKDTSNVRCWRCHEKGHPIKECPKPKDYEAPAGEKKSDTKSDGGGKNFTPKKTFLCALSARLTEGAIVIDSVAEGHMSLDKKSLVNYKDCEFDQDVVGGDNGRLRVAGTGDIKLSSNNSINKMPGVLYVPGLSTILLSVSHCTDRGINVLFMSIGCQFVDADDCVVSGSVLDDVKFTNVNDDTCVARALDKQSRQSFSRSISPKVSEVLDLVHADLCGSLPERFWWSQVRGDKLDARSKCLVFAGYDKESKGYRLFDLDKPKGISVKHSVKFDEGKFTVCSEGVTDVSDVVYCPVGDLVEGNDVEEAPVDGEDDDFRDAEHGDFEGESVGKKISGEINENVQNRRYPLRDRKRKEFPDFEMYSTFSYCNAVFDDHFEPDTVSQALKGKDSIYWKKAMNEEIQSYIENNVWDLVDKPVGKKVVKCKWVFKIKRNCDGDVAKFKARLVAVGCSQKYGIDFLDTYAPVVRYSMLRLFFSLSVKLDLQIHHVDISTAFLNGDLKEEIYMCQPDGFVTDDGKVCILHLAVYGLKQASRCWYEKVHIILEGRKPVSGYVFKLCNGPISWESSKQEVTALSSIGAEYTSVDLKCNFHQYQVRREIDLMAKTLKGTSIIVSGDEQEFPKTGSAPKSQQNPDTSITVSGDQQEFPKTGSAPAEPGITPESQQNPDTARV